MATTINKTTSYAGTASAQYIRRTFFNAETILNGWFTVKENVSKPYKIRRLQSTGLVADKTCDFTPVGTVTINERVLSPADLEVNLELCKDQFLGDWDESTMGSGAMNKSLPKAVADGMIAEIQESVGEDVERMIYMGDTGSGDQFDGVVTIYLADPLEAKVSGTVDADGFAGDPLRELALIKADAIAKLTWSQRDFEIIMSPTNASAYQDALRTAGSGQENISADAPLMYNGKPIRVTYGITDTYVLAGRVSNFWFGTDLLSDANEVILKDMSDTDLSDNVRFKQVMTGGVQYGFTEEVTLYEAQLV